MSALTQNKFLTDAEIHQFKMLCENHTGERDSILLRLSFYTGARPAEVLQIRPTDLSHNKVTIFGKKNSNDRTVPLPGNFYKELLHYVTKQHTGSEKKIFPISTRRFATIWDNWKPGGCSKSLKSLRHTFGVKLYLNCRDIMKVKYVLGHVTISSSMHYLTYVESMLGLKSAIIGMWEGEMIIDENNK